MDFTLPGIPTTVAVAIVATIGYLFGRSTRTPRDAARDDARRDLRRATVVAKELEAIADELRKNLASHHSSLSRFQERVSQLGGGQAQSAWNDLCHEAQEMLKPTMRLASHLAQAYDEIRQQSNHLMTFTDVRTDPLTGVSNRRALEESLDMMFALFARYDRPFSIAILDIDHFKQVNDSHGHLHGDKTLREMATLVRDCVRETDVVARYGGEEFVVVMPHTTLEGAVVSVERIRRALAKGLKLTVSGGVAQALDGDNPTSLLGRSDQALYAAKAAGRNRAFYHNGEAVHPIAPEPLVALGA